MAAAALNAYNMRMRWKRVITIDPSLTCSGWALFSLSDDRLLAVGKIRSRGPRDALAHRLVDLQQKISRTFESLAICENDVLICEAPTTMRDPRAALVVEQVRGIFETVARQIHVTVPGRINPRSVQYEVMGLRGKQLKREIVKESARRVVEHLYFRSLMQLGVLEDPSLLSKHQDIVDAVLLGHYALAKVREAAASKLPLESFFSQNASSRSPQPEYS